MTRAYLRLDPGFFEKKLEQGYSPSQIGTYIACLCLADASTRRGRFRDVHVLKALLTPAYARQVPYLLERGDLILYGKSVYVDGWDEWQEGDLTVPERMARLRSRPARVTKPVVTPVTPDVTPPVTAPRKAKRSVAKRSKAESGAPSQNGAAYREENLRLAREAVARHEAGEQALTPAALQAFASLIERYGS